MNRKVLLVVLLLVMLLIVSGCSKNLDETLDVESNNSIESGEENMSIEKIKVILDDNEYVANMEDNETASSFISLFPLDFSMKELNGNEKYFYMDESLPINSSNPKHINAGDIMLYGDDCVVIFYKSFDTSYNYTKIGHIDNLPNLGDGNVNVRFEVK